MGRVRVKGGVLIPTPGRVCGCKKLCLLWEAHIREFRPNRVAKFKGTVYFVELAVKNGNHPVELFHPKDTAFRSGLFGQVIILCSQKIAILSPISLPGWAGCLVNPIPGFNKKSREQILRQHTSFEAKIFTDSEELMQWLMNGAERKAPGIDDHDHDHCHMPEN